VTSHDPQRLGFDIERIMRTRYKIDSYQSTYFVIDSFEQLLDATAPDFKPIYRRVAGLRELAADETVPSDRVF
jgi:phenylalanine-4-hydroxylase